MKYLWSSIEVLLYYYNTYVRSQLEYCAVVFHPGLTKCQTNKIENIERTSLRIILGDNYIGYQEALEMTGMATFIQRREESCLKFGIKCASNPRTSLIFPRNVNFARTEAYKRSPLIIYIDY